MKKFLACLVYGFCSIGFGAPIGDPATPHLIREGFFISPESRIDVRAGYEGDFVADARMEQYAESTGRVDCYSQETNAGTATLNFVDRLDLYGILGSSRTCADWRFTINGDTHRAQIETLYNFLWGIGARGILYESGCATFGVGSRYEQAHYDNMWLTIDGLVQHVAGTFLHWRSFQIDADVAYQIDIFSPYIGIKYSYVRAKIGNFATPIADNGGGIDQFKNRTAVGVFIGCSLSSGKYFMLNIEGRLIDEEAVTISGDFRF